MISFIDLSGLGPTSSQNEWEFVVCPQLDQTYHFEVAQRLPVPISTFYARAEAGGGANDELRKCLFDPLIHEEIVGARLYTGPMGYKYNRTPQSGGILL